MADVSRAENCMKQKINLRDEKQYVGNAACVWQVWEQTGQGWGAASKLEVVPRETTKMEKQKYARLKKNQNKKLKRCGTATKIAT